MRINFLNWRPDAEDFGHDGLTVAQNVYSDSEGYKVSKTTGDTFKTVGGMISATSESFFAVDKLGGSDYGNDDYLAIFHRATDNRVLIGTVGAWSEYEATGPAGATAGSLSSFGSVELADTIVATAKFNWASALPTTTTISSGYITYAGTYGAGSTWTDLPNSAKGVVCGVINNFVFVANEGLDSDYEGQLTVRWSAIGDATDWPTPGTDDARTKQAGKQVMRGQYGRVTGIASNDFYGYIFQENAITKLTYVGGDVVFAFDTFEEQRGCGYLNRLVAIDDRIFFESLTQRHVLENEQIVDIGYGRVDDSYPPITTDGTRLYKNPAQHLVFFSNNLCYNYKTDQWTYLPNITARVNIDSATGMAGQYRLSSGIAPGLLYDSTNGTAETATLTTGAADLNVGGRTVVHGVRPLVNGGTNTVRVGTQDDLSDAVTWSTSTSLNSRTGFANMRSEGRYIRAEITMAGGFTTAQGADIDAKPQGKV